MMHELPAKSISEIELAFITDYSKYLKIIMYKICFSNMISGKTKIIQLDF